MAGQRHLVTLSEASRMAERSERSLRRWIAEGRIKDHRPAGDRASPVLVDRDELLAACAVQAPRTVGAGRVSGRDNHRVQAVEVELRARIDELSAHLADAKSDRDRARSEVARLQAELTEARRVIAELQRRLEAPTGRRLLSWLGLGK